MSKVDLDRFTDFMVEYKKEIVKDYEKEIERLNNILDTLMQDMVLVDATSKKELKPKHVFDRIAMLRGVDKE